MTVDGEKVRLLRDAVEWRQVEDEIVALDRRASEYLAINPSGAKLWPALVEGASIPELVRVLMTAYEIDEDAATRDVTQFVGMLRDRELLEP